MHVHNSLLELKEIREKMPTGPDNHGTQDTALIDSFVLYLFIK